MDASGRGGEFYEADGVRDAYLRHRHERTGLGDPNNPLLGPDDAVYGYVAISEDDYALRLRAAS